jgi:hypothetical protein
MILVGRKTIHRSSPTRSRRHAFDLLTTQGRQNRHVADHSQHVARPILGYQAGSSAANPADTGRPAAVAPVDDRN